MLATDLADYLVRKGVPFRKAHHTVGELVALAEHRGKPLNQLALSDLRSVDKVFGPDALEVFDLKRALSRRNLPGAPGPDAVRAQVARWRELLA